MRYLVLGSRGQIGSHLMEYLTEHLDTECEGEDEVMGLDILSCPCEDLREYNEEIEEAIKEADMVYFLAFDVGGAKYLEKYQDTYEFIDNNIKIMDKTFALLKKHEKPFIFASSQMAEMYYSTYGVLKSIGERMTKSLGGVIARFWNVYGYEEDEEKSHVITDFIKMAKYNGEINMRTDGEEMRQFLHADDASECLLTLSNKWNEIEKGVPFHITNFKWTKILWIAQYIQKISGCKININDRKDQTQRNALNEPNTKILKYWKPKTLLNKGMDDLYKLY